jgi:hypothetical protein
MNNPYEPPQSDPVSWSQSTRQLWEDISFILLAIAVVITTPLWLPIVMLGWFVVEVCFPFTDKFVDVNMRLLRFILVPYDKDFNVKDFPSD